MKRQARTRFTFGQGAVGEATWSGDSERIYFSAMRGGHRGIFVKEANGTEEERLILSSGEDRVTEIYLNDVSRDDRFMSYERVTEDQRHLISLHLRFSALAAGLIVCGILLVTLLLWHNMMLTRAQRDLHGLAERLRGQEQAATAASRAKSITLMSAL